MRIRSLILQLCLPFTLLALFSLPSFALFQNSDAACENHTVLCSSSTCATNTTGVDQANTLVCKKSDGTLLDFNQDGAPDCVAGRGSGSETNLFSYLLGNPSATGCGNLFSEVEDHALDVIGINFETSSIAAGSLGGSDVVMIPYLDIFAGFVAVVQNGTGTDEQQIFVLAADTPAWDGSGTNYFQQNGFSPIRSEKNALNVDCNGDGNDELAMVVETQNVNLSPGASRMVYGINLNILKGSSSQLDDINLVDSYQVVTEDLNNKIASMAVGDFDENNTQDIAVAINDSNASFLVICSNDGSCGYTCGTPLDITQGGENPQPFSIVAGDFDGDTHQDVAMTEPGLMSTKGVRYYFGDGAGNYSTSSSLHVSYPNPSIAGNQILSTGCFNNDNNTDVAVSYGAGPSGSFVGVISLSDASHTSGSATFTSLTAPIRNGSSLDAADFDSQGGDDLVVIGTDLVSTNRNAYVFMNTVETLSVDAGSDQSAYVGETVDLSGTCSFTPSDTTDRFDYTWILSSVPAGSNASLTQADTATPQLTPDIAGDYVLQLQCRSRCTEIANDTLALTVSESEAPGPGATPTLPPGLTAQGGCIASLNPATSSTGIFSSTIFIIVTLGVFYMLKIQRRKSSRSVLPVLALAALLFSSQAKALTPSFSTDFFKPAIDDSDFFSVYSSPTMKKGNYHLGGWLSYAHHPYEVADFNYNRNSGITNSLLSGDMVGSVGILDWLNVGGRVPAQFWNAVRAPLLNRPSENNINFGDIELDAKFQLLDRTKYPIGISVMPFINVPSATRAVKDFSGNGGVTGGGRLILDTKIKRRVSFAVNAGYEVRQPLTEIGGNNIDDHVQLGAGLAVDVWKKRHDIEGGYQEWTALKLIGETQIETVAKDFFNRHTTPAEARFGARYSTKGGLDVNLGGGMGYTNGISSPDFRVLAGVTYTARPIDTFMLPQPPIGEWSPGDEIKLEDQIYFDFDKSTIRDISKPTLDKAAGVIKKNPQLVKIRVEGHTDDLGTDRYNQKLSERRAKSVVDYLVQQGVEASRLTSVGYGESRPLVPNVNESSREKNRRVQFFVEEVSKK